MQNELLAAAREPQHGSCALVGLRGDVLGSSARLHSARDAMSPDESELGNTILSAAAAPPQRSPAVNADRPSSISLVLIIRS